MRDKTKAIFLDRDGVFLEDKGVLTSLDIDRLYHETGECLVRLKRAGYLLFLISNQSVVARGLLSEEECKNLNEEIFNSLCSQGISIFDEVCLCFDHPEAQVKEYRNESFMRKPNNGALEYLIERFQVERSLSFMVGDRESDIIAGNLSSLNSVLIGEGQSRIRYFRSYQKADKREDFKFKSLKEFTEEILSGRLP